jgi:hypothetical protein
VTTPEIVIVVLGGGKISGIQLEVFSKSQVISYIETKSPMRMCRRSFRTSPDDDLMSGKGAQ